MAKGALSDDQLEKIDGLVFSDNIENIRTGLTLMCALAPEYLCRYLELIEESISCGNRIAFQLLYLQSTSYLSSSCLSRFGNPRGNRCL